MQCPVDGNTLEKYTIDGIVVEKCPDCQGFWFAKGQLRLAKDAEGLDLAWLDFDLWSDQDSLEADWSTRKCPLCIQSMATIIYGNTDVKIDYCVKEHGIWLDSGEFENIIDSLNDELVTLNLPEYVTASLEEAKEIISGDKGLIYEWKDLQTVIRLIEYKVLADNPKLMDALIALGKSPL